MTRGDDRSSPRTPSIADATLSASLSELAAKAKRPLRSRIETTDPIDAFARAVTCEDVSVTGFVYQWRQARSPTRTSDGRCPPLAAIVIRSAGSLANPHRYAKVITGTSPAHEVRIVEPRVDRAAGMR